MRTRVFLLVACLLCHAWTARAQDAPFPFKAEIVDFGLYEHVGPVEIRPAPNTASGKVAEHDELRLVRATDEVPAVLGSTFGFRYVVLGVPDGLLEGFAIRALHPPMRGPDGRISSTSTTRTELFGIRGIAGGEIAYTLSEPFEVLRGTWQLQVLYKGKPVLSKSFVLK